MEPQKLSYPTRSGNIQEASGSPSDVVVNISIEKHFLGEGNTAMHNYVLKKTLEFVTSDYIVEEHIQKVEFEKVSVAAERARGEIKEMAAVAESQEENIRKVIVGNEETAQQLKRSNEAVQADINNEFAKAIVQLEASRDKLLLQAQACYVDRAKDLTMQRDLLVEAKNKKSEARKVAEQTLEENDMAIILLREKVAELIGDELGDVKAMDLDPAACTFMTIEPERADLKKVEESVSNIKLRLERELPTLTGYGKVRAVQAVEAKKLPSPSVDSSSGKNRSS